MFGHLTRKDVDTDKIFFNAVLQDTKFRKVVAVVIIGITNESVKVQFLEKRSNSEAVFRFVRHDILLRFFACQSVFSNYSPIQKMSFYTPVHRRCRAGRRPDFVRKTMQVHRRCTQLGPETRPAKCLAEEL